MTFSDNNGFPLSIPFLQSLGVQCLRAEKGHSEIALDLGAQHLNSYGIAHGGVTMTLLDVAMAMAGRSADTLGRGVVTIEMKSSFMQPGSGRLRGLGRCVHRSTTMAFCEAEIVDADGKLVARGSGTFKYVKSMPQRRSSGVTPGGDG